MAHNFSEFLVTWLSTTHLKNVYFLKYGGIGITERNCFDDNTVKIMLLRTMHFSLVHDMNIHA